MTRDDDPARGSAHPRGGDPVPQGSSLVPYGWSDRWRALLADSTVQGRPGRVVRQDRGSVLVVTAVGSDAEVAMRAVTVRPHRTGPVVTGDWVVIDDDGVAAAVLTRRSLLTRRDPGDEVDQPLVANADLVLAVCALDRGVSHGRIDRTATQAWQAGAQPMVLLTKADLVDDVEALVDDVAEQQVGVDVVAVSTVDDSVTRLLAPRLADRTSVLVGPSGAGKSTVVNRLLGHERVATGAVRNGDAKGRHTTTSRELHLLPPPGGVLIDTPGLRALGLAAEAGSVDAVFGEITALADGCRFRDCAHDSEPGCAVRDALATGALDPERYDEWRSLRREAAAWELRSNEHERRREGRRFAAVAREAQRLKRNR